jgi:hypothetical protein
MKIHPREQRVREAQNDVSTYLSLVKRENELTEAEMLRVVNNVCHEWVGGVAKYWIREERHGNSDTPGGLEGSPAGGTGNE